MDDYATLKASTVNWAELLFTKLQELRTPETLEEAVAPIRRLAQIAEQTAKPNEEPRHRWNEAMFAGQMGAFEVCLDSLLTGELEGYNREFAKAIHAYTLEKPSIYKICNKELIASDRRAADGGVSEGVQAVLSFYKLLMSALLHLPASFRHQEKAYRGVKHVYPSPDDHRPEDHFRKGGKLIWLEMKSSSRDFKVMYREHFCGLAGARTIFTVREPPLTGFRIEVFSAMDDEFEVLFPPLSMFEIVETTKQWDEKNKIGFPDAVLLEQKESKWNLAQLFDQGAVSEAAATVTEEAVPAVAAKEGGYTAAQAAAAPAGPQMDAKAWLELGVKGGGTVAGVSYTEKQCYLHALEIDANYAPAWNGLGAVGGGQVQGVAYTPKQCYEKSLELDPKDSFVWKNLASCGGGTVAGVAYTADECKRRAKKMGPPWDDVPLYPINYANHPVSGSFSLTN